MKNLMVKRVPEELMERLRKQAEREDRTIKAVVLRALRLYLDEAEGRK
jgi:predicted DNA-binding protein